MVSYYLKRIGMALLVLFVSITFAFFVFRIMPSSPTQALEQKLINRAQEAGQPVNRERIERLVSVYTGINPDKPIPVAYVDYLSDAVLNQDFGRSVWKNEPVFDYLIDKVPWSIFLSIYGLAVGRTVGILLGAVMAYKEGTRTDNAITLFTIINRGIPYYFVAIIGLVVLSFNLGWFPTSGRVNPHAVAGLNYPYIAGVLNHAALPILTTIVAGFGGGIAFRGNAIREMGQEYIKLAHLRGISGSRIAIRYIGRNAILPVYTGIVIGLAGLFSSSIIIEKIFTYPAVGYATYNALIQRDYPLLMGAFIMFTTITIIGVLIADLTYGLIDPRIDTGGDREAF